MVSTALGRSVTCRTLPQNASWVHSRSMAGGVTVRTGATPPNVNAYCSGSGRNSTTSIGGLPLLVKRPATRATGSALRLPAPVRHAQHPGQPGRVILRGTAQPVAHRFGPHPGVVRYLRRVRHRAAVGEGGHQHVVPFALDPARARAGGVVGAEPDF